MITENEKAKMREIEAVVHAMGESLTIEGEQMPEELRAAFTGTNLATLDAMFAIREGTEWRGHTDPKEIARELLRAAQIGE